MSGTSPSNDNGAAGSVDHDTAEQGGPPRLIMLKRAAMAAATAFLSINIWTGAPLLAVWVGSQVSGRSILSMKAVLVVILVLAALVVASAMALAWLNDTYDAADRTTAGRSASPLATQHASGVGGRNQKPRRDNGARADRHDQRVSRRHHVRHLVLLLRRIPARTVSPLTADVARRPARAQPASARASPSTASSSGARTAATARERPTPASKLVPSTP